MVETPWLTATQAGEYAHRGYDTIVQACRSGELVAMQRIRKGKWLIKVEDLDEWIRGKNRVA